VSKPLTRAQRDALTAASRRKGGVPVSRERPLPKGAVTAYMASRLTREGWVTRVNDTLLITSAGRSKLNEPIPDSRTLYLARSGRYTTNPKRSIDHDEPPGSWGGPVAVPASGQVSADWRERSESHRRAAREDVDASRLSGLTHPEERLAELRRMAAERGLDISSELRYVKHGLKVLERKVRREDDRAA
jgi:hypothetical protein